MGVSIDWMDQQTSGKRHWSAVVNVTGEQTPRVHPFPTAKAAAIFASNNASHPQIESTEVLDPDGVTLVGFVLLDKDAVAWTPTKTGFTSL